MAGRPLVAGDVLAGYEVIRELGTGGMGTVYLARHPRLPRNQALKVLASSLGTDPAFRERFRREAHLAAQLDHPNIVAVQDAGVDDDVMWIAMQFVDGTDAAALVRTGPLPAAHAIDIVAQVAAGLDHAHAHGMLHRDVKPANILVTTGWEGESPRALIGDFGIARSLAETSGLTNTGAVIGSLAYTAPELLTDAPPTPAVDQYALGCTLYELLAGEVVFPRGQNLALMQAHAHDPVPRLSDLRSDLPHELDAVIARALAKQPADRYPSCRDFVAAVTAAMTRESAIATGVASFARPRDMSPTTPATARPMQQPHPTLPQAWPSDPRSSGAPPAVPTGGRSRTPLIAAAAVAVVAVLAGGAGLVWWSSSRGSDTVGTSIRSATTPSDSTPPTTSSDSTTASGTAAPSTLSGTWRGPVFGDQTGFDVAATFSTASPVSAVVRYPQLGCEGTWTEQSRDGDDIKVAEHITAGRCVDSEVTLTAEQAGTLNFLSTYYSASKGRTLVIYGTMVRQSS